jgi:hypothetical protein
MPRRPMVLLALAISSFVLAACSDTTAPRRDGDDGSCRSGVIVGSGRTCDGSGGN